MIKIMKSINWHNNTYNNTNDNYNTNNNNDDNNNNNNNNNFLSSFKKQVYSYWLNKTILRDFMRQLLFFYFIL